MSNNKVNAGEIQLKQKNEQISKICAFFSADFFSFFVLIVFTDYTNITAVKYNIFLILTVVLVLVYCFKKGGMILEGQVSFKTARINYLPYFSIGGFVGFSCFSALFSPFLGVLNDKGQSMLLLGDKRYDGLLVILFYIILFLIFSFEKSYRKGFTYVVTATLGIATFVGILQLFGINVFDFFPQDGNYAVTNFYVYKKFISTIGNIDMVSAMYCLLLPIVGFDLVAENKKIYLRDLQTIVYVLSVFLLWEIGVDSGRVALIAMFIIAFNVLFFKSEWYLRFLNLLIYSAVGIILSTLLEFSYDLNACKLSVSLNRRGCILWLGITVLIVVFALVYKYILQKNRLKTAFWWILGIEALGFIVIFYLVLNYSDSSQGAFYEFAEILKGRGKDSFGSNRYGLWKYTLGLANERFLIGYGAGTFRTAFAEYAEEYSSHFGSGIYDFAHNEFLQIYYNSGIFGLISYIGFVGILMFKGIKNCYKNNKVMILTFAMICFLVQSFFMFSIIIVSPLFWITAGMLCYEIRNAKIL